MMLALVWILEVSCAEPVDDSQRAYADNGALGVVEEKAATLVVLLAGEETFVSDARAG